LDHGGREGKGDGRAGRGGSEAEKREGIGGEGRGRDRRSLVPPNENPGYGDALTSQVIQV